MRSKSDIKVQTIYHLYKDQGKEKLTFRDGKQISCHLGPGPNGIIKGDIRKHCGADGNVLLLHRYGDFMGAHNCQNSSNCTVKMYTVYST